ncbi:hypothetical protein [Streptomyces longisporoflavus]|uniref:Uncharacterized protein n=1 Tax=Streptomyces longisporoflavus TaxID=28044 RepID=A0ABW7QGY9_9ACTN
MEKDDLVQSSRYLMHEALGGLTEEAITHNLTVLKAGIATEHLLKGYLCTIHPSLITDARDLPSLLHAAGRGELTTKPLALIKTIGIVDAYKRVYEILGKERLTLAPAQFQDIADARNGVAHLAVSSSESVERLLSLVIKIADTLLAEMKENSDSFWEDYAPVRLKILEENRKADLIIIAALKTKARKTVEERFGGRNNERREAAITAAAQYCGVRGTGAVQRKCPACSYTGWLGGDLTTALHDEKQPEVVLVTDSFKCSVCGFVLRGPMLQHIDDWLMDIPMGSAATFVYADGTTHEDLWLALVAEENAANWDEEQRRRLAEEEILRAQMGAD